MKIVIAGGSGHIGSFLAQALHDRGEEVTVLSRGRANTPWRTVIWDGRTVGDWSNVIDGAHVVINLAGRSVDCRYHERQRRQILESRTLSTRVVGQAIAKAEKPPSMWLQASTATIYAHRFDAANDEQRGIIGGGEPGVPETWRFSIDVAKAWERELDAAETPFTRKVKLRTAIVMAPARGGPFQHFRGLARRGLGGPHGDGREFMSWIHHRDFVRAVDWIIEHERLEGPINIAAPNPLPNADFMRVLRETCGVRFGLPLKAWMLEIGAFFLRTETELLLKSRRVVPGRLLKDGFQFEFPTWPEAARNLCASGARSEW
jgi:uncharacterized protein (TIGR01777 family)